MQGHGRVQRREDGVAHPFRYQAERESSASGSLSRVVGDEEDELDGQAELELGLLNRRVVLGVVDRAHSKDDDVDVDVVEERRETEVSKGLCRAAYRREQHRQCWRAMRASSGKGKRGGKSSNIYTGADISRSGSFEPSPGNISPAPRRLEAHQDSCKVASDRPTIDSGREPETGELQS